MTGTSLWPFARERRCGAITADAVSAVAITASAIAISFPCASRKPLKDFPLEC
ncbi:hypothetical protein J2S43_001130 [Catenuloplanes nepalensis]|uniref:Uncharacterized protein n=1 Tax=Catenuloplanes nepalensis TaxID=587533 RepID=A0ABT9MMU9_9ACTN|nr:hypothetical protein [Catenuloplanes nepalensis]